MNFNMVLVYDRNQLSAGMFNVIKETVNVQIINQPEDIAKANSSSNILYAFIESCEPHHLTWLERIKKTNNTAIVLIIKYINTPLLLWAIKNKIDDVIQVGNEKEVLQSFKRFNLSSNSVKAKLSHYKTFEATEYINKHYKEDIRLSHVAQVCNMGERSFSRAFAKENNCTFRDYLRNYRLEKAKIMLIYTDNSIKNISYSVGYEDVSSFCKLFKEREKLTPLEYRNSHLEALCDTVAS